MLLLQRLDRELFEPVLILQRRDGDYLAQLGDGVEVDELRRKRPPFCVVELAGILRNRRIDLLYTVTNATNIYAVAAARLARTGVRVVISEHTPLSFSLTEAKLRPLRRAGMRAAYPRATLAVAPLEQIGHELRAFLGPGSPPFRCLPNPVVDALAPPRPPPAVALRIVSVGRLAPVKRFDLLIEAFAAFRGRHPEATLTLFGDGAERSALERVAENLGVADAVAFAGYVEDVASRLRDADMFVCTSAREGFGNAIVEAMAAGVPVVSVDCPFGPAILLRDGEAGRLVPKPSAATVAEAMAVVAGDAELRARYVHAGRMVAATFTVERSIDAYTDAFLAVSGQAGAPAAIGFGTKAQPALP